MTEAAATFFLLDDVPWPEEKGEGGAPAELMARARAAGARRKFLARGEGGFHSQWSAFAPGFEVPAHSHDHSELIVVLTGGCTMLDGGPTLDAGDSMVLPAGHRYGFVAGPEGLEMLTIRTGVATVSLD